MQGQQQVLVVDNNNEQITMTKDQQGHTKIEKNAETSNGKKSSLDNATNGKL